MINEATIIQRKRGYSAVVYRALDLLLIQLALLSAVYAYSAVYTSDYFSLSLLACIGYLFIAESGALYSDHHRGSVGKLLVQPVLFWGLSVTLVLAFLFFSKQGAEYSRVQLGLWFVLAALFLVSWRLLRWQYLQSRWRQGQHVRRAAIFGLSENGLRLATKVCSNSELGYQLVAIFDDRSKSRLPEELHHLVEGDIKNGIAAAKSGDFESVFIGLPLQPEERVLAILYELGDSTADVYLVPDAFIASLLTASRDQVEDVNTLSIFGTPIQGMSSLLKRSEDLILSALLLCLAAIPLLIIAMAIKFTSKGPVLFQQDRYGLGGKRIKVLKFRSMTVTENDAVVTQASRDDDRITPLGKFLRRSSLDELPQLINVLRGEMSLVGPRPHAVAHNEQYRTQIDYYMMRHKMKPGITGLAQVRGWRGETDTLEKMQMRIESDLDYIQNWSLWLDFKILLITLPRLFIDRNAY